MMLQRDTHYTGDGKSGQIGIETAITFSITLIFICTIISVIVYYRADILMQRSVEQACEEVSLIPPTSIVFTDTLSTLVNAFPDVEVGSEKGREVISRVASAVVGVDSFTGNTLEDMFLEGTLAHVMADNIRNGYIERNNGSDFFVPDSIDVDLNIDGSRHLMEVLVTYETYCLAGRIQRQIYSIVPLYGDSELFLNADASDSEGDDIWSKDNFTRGDYFRDQYGANLPKTFPVIDRFSNGTCESIVSIDLTAPTYSTAAGILKKIKEEIDDLSAFNGADVIISGDRYTVRSRDIRDKVLTVVVPTNSEDSSVAVISGLSAYAALNGVTVRIEQYGTSSRYAE